MTLCLLIRHATTDHVGHVLGGWTPGVHLNTLGVAQAESLAARLAPVPLAAIYASPLERAQQTAARIAARQRIDVQVTEEAGEVRFGAWTGRSFAELAGDAAWQRWNHMRSVARAPGGETALEVQARIVALLERLRMAHPDSAVAVVSHADVIKLALVHVLGSPIDWMRRIEISPASISTLALDEADVRVLGINDAVTAPVR
jgi:probable phosphoglycerate mutase